MPKLNSVDKVYHDLVDDILTNGSEKGDRTGTGTISVFGRMIRFDLQDGFPLLTTKKMWIPGIIHELLWFLNGDTNIKYLTDNNVHIWDEWADEDGDLGPVYGKQWVDWTGLDRSEIKLHTVGINQIQNAIDTLRTNPDSRRILVSAWNVGELDSMALLPCHYAFQFYTTELTELERVKLLEPYGFDALTVEARDKFMIEHNVPTRKLSLKWNQRSVDTGLGLPYNIASYAFLTHMVAQQVNMVPGDLIGDLGDTHIYSNHVSKLKEQLTRESYPLGRLSLILAKDIFSYDIDDFSVMGYESHPTIKMDISV